MTELSNVVYDTLRYYVVNGIKFPSLTQFMTKFLNFIYRFRAGEHVGGGFN